MKIDDRRKAARKLLNAKSPYIEMAEKLFYCPWCKAEHKVLINPDLYSGIKAGSGKKFGPKKLPGQPCEGCFEREDL